MASPSTQTAEVAEREVEQVERAEKPANLRFLSPRPAPGDTRWVIKLSGYIPN